MDWIKRPSLLVFCVTIRLFCVCRQQVSSAEEVKHKVEKLEATVAQLQTDKVRVCTEILSVVFLSPFLPSPSPCLLSTPFFSSPPSLPLPFILFLCPPSLLLPSPSRALSSYCPPLLCLISITLKWNWKWPPENSRKSLNSYLY